MDRPGTTLALFGESRAMIGMLHLGALPGSPEHRMALDAIVARAVEEARIYKDAGFHGLMIENMRDRPYLKGRVGPETVAAMAVVGYEVRREVPLPLGVQVLAGANREAIAVAIACGARFVRVEGYVFAHVADEGTIEASAGELLRYRDAMEAEHVRVFADVKKKHASHAITADVSLLETALAAEFSLADGVIVSGVATGRETDPADVRTVTEAVSVPVYVGSGVTPENLDRYGTADGFILGSAVKKDGHWANQLEPARVAAIAEAFRALPKRKLPARARKA
jgi:uncharacterized protein